MKKNYENITFEIIYFSAEDIVRTSNNDNTADMPDFPEDFE